MVKQAFLVGIAVGMMTPSFISQGTDELTPASLRQMVDGLGYTIKDLNTVPGKEKFLFNVTYDKLEVPINAELSSDTHYVWLTVYLGPPPGDVAKHTDMLRQNFFLQPDNFYITSKDNLMMGVAIDNRGVTTPVLRRVVDKLSADVAKTAPIWQTSAGASPQQPPKE